PEMNQLLLLRAFLGFRLLAIGDVGPYQDCAPVGTTQGFDGDLEPDDAPRPMRSVFEAMMQRPAGNHLVRAVTQARRKCIALRAKFRAMTQKIFSDLEVDERRGGNALGKQAP